MDQLITVKKTMKGGIEIIGEINCFDLSGIFRLKVTG